MANEVLETELADEDSDKQTEFDLNNNQDEETT